MSLPKPVQTAVDNAMRDLPHACKTCYKCKSYVAMRVQDKLLDGQVVGHYYAVMCEKCNSTGGESEILPEAISFWIAKHKLLSAKKKGGRRGHPFTFS